MPHPRPARARRWLLLAPLVVVLLVGLAVAADWYRARPIDAPRTFVGRQTCSECHAPQAAAWSGSNHDRGMDYATPESVLADFNDQRLAHFDATWRMFRRDEEFFVETENRSGELATYPIRYTIGVRPLQQYLVEFDDGRVQVLPVAWDTDARRWFHLYPDEPITPDDVLHWTRWPQTWNHMCGECHTTGYEKHFDLERDTYHTSYTEIDVSCEACHGPGSLHVELARAPSLFWDRRHGYALAPLKSADSRVELETCARCHAHRGVVREGFQPGDRFDDYYALALLDGSVYRPDGQIHPEIEAYEYGSFLQSRMYREGVRCTDCHEPHSATLRAEGNALCNRCHVEAKYDAPSHHHHQPGTAAAQCVSCHMPTTTYMVVDPRHDHSLRVPRPDISALLGTPNACDRCHDQPHESAEWAAARLVEWYGPRRPDDPRFDLACAAARQGDRAVEPELVAWLRRRTASPLVRASAAALLAQYDGATSGDALIAALGDSQSLVRAAAVRALGLRPEVLDASTAAHQRANVGLLARLDDPVALVRGESVRVLAAMPAPRLSAAQQATFDAALDEYIQSQLATADTPAAHLNLGGLLANLGDVRRAEWHYWLAAERFGELDEPFRHLAMLYAQQGRFADAEEALRRVLARTPDSAEDQFRLGLLLAEQPGRLDDALAALATAARLAPEEHRIRYNLGLALQHAGRAAEARRELLAAHEAAPSQPDYVRALAVFYAQRRDWQRAESFAARLVELSPNDPLAGDLAAEIARAARQPQPAGPAGTAAPIGPAGPAAP